MVNAIEHLQEELRLVENHIAFLDKTILSKGILVIPEELEAAWDDVSFASQLTEALHQPVQEGWGSAQFAGIIVRGPIDSLKEIRHIDFSGDKEFRQVLCARAYDLRSRIQWVENENDKKDS